MWCTIARCGVVALLCSVSLPKMRGKDLLCSVSLPKLRSQCLLCGVPLPDVEWLPCCVVFHYQKCGVRICCVVFHCQNCVVSVCCVVFHYQYLTEIQKRRKTRWCGKLTIPPLAQHGKPDQTASLSYHVGVGSTTQMAYRRS